MAGELSGKAAMIVGASRGLGRGITLAFAEAGASVIAVARSASELAHLTSPDTRINIERADATDPATAWRLLDHYAPELLILVAGASPVMHSIQHQTWETFSVNWEADVKIAFT